MLIRNSKGEISYLSPKGVRHALTKTAYEVWFDSSPFVNVTDEQYNVFARGADFAKSVSFGEIESEVVA